ncbi:uncharacterized protein I206_105092 [Kwoniella pini CBS 10737]|uniref:Uncharacterized protein n=1 Tax=Kwoniella pini CBS 10737 TaxID=1296096 RepID=A0A1B9I8S2_9TREE|nr:uncharacterized protein I206_02632 [Kwoniella pini CBS 10737]OCF51916.1 hypothetical protein I206_02632 [Kwoniella pini CBS 10737]
MYSPKHIISLAFNKFHEYKQSQPSLEIPKCKWADPLEIHSSKNFISEEIIFKDENALHIYQKVIQYIKIASLEFKLKPRELLRRDRISKEIIKSKLGKRARKQWSSNYESKERNIQKRQEDRIDILKRGLIEVLLQYSIYPSRFSRFKKSNKAAQDVPNSRAKWILHNNLLVQKS